MASEEAVIAVAPKVEAPPSTEPAEVKSAVKTPKTKKAKEAKAKEPKAKAAKKPVAPRKAKASASHPSYLDMIIDAISSLKERTGSSQYAITKFIEDKQKNLPPNFKKLLLNNLKKLVVAEKLVKVKGSYKLPPKTKPASSSAPTKKKPAIVAKSNSKENCGGQESSVEEVIGEEIYRQQKVKKHLIYRVDENCNVLRVVV